MQTTFIVCPLVENWRRVGERKKGEEEVENRPRSPVGTNSSGDSPSLQRFVSKMKLNFLLFAPRFVVAQFKTARASIDTNRSKRATTMG